MSMSKQTHGYSSATLRRVTDDTMASILGAERAALILTARNCRASAQYRHGIETLLHTRELPGITLGALVVDEPGVEEFLLENGWLADVEALPFTVLYRRGQRVDGFAAFSPGSFMRRLERLNFVPDHNSINFNVHNMSNLHMHDGECAAD